MKFRLPKLNFLIKKDKENTQSASNYIFVRENHAIAFSPNSFFVVDLREYLKRELDIYDEDDIQEMDLILEYMDGKVFYPEFWKELTSTTFVGLKEDLVIELESYEKVLNYEEPFLDKDSFENHMDTLKKVLSTTPSTVDRICMAAPVVSDIHKAFANELKNDNLVFDFSGRSGSFLFTLQRREYIFGAVSVHYEESMDLTVFLNVRDFAAQL